MKFNINDLTKSEREVDITFDYVEIKEDIESEVKKQSKNIQLPGFRKGKVPLNVLKKMYGDALEYEASEKVANKRFWDIAEKEHFHPVGQPRLTDIKFKPGEEFTFKVIFEVIPQLEVKNYKDLEIQVPELAVKDEDVESEIKYILKTNSTKEDVDTIGEDNNYIIDVEVRRINEDGKDFPDTKPEKLEIDLSNERVQSEIITNARGKKLGESFNFTFTDNRKEKDDAGNEKEISEIFLYSAKINGIKKIVEPELNEELIKKVTKDKASNQDDLRIEIRKDIQTYVDQRTEDFITNKILELVIKNNDFVPPSSLVSNVLEDLVKHEEESSKKQGYGKFNREEAAKRLRTSAEFEVKWYLIKNEIQKKENLTIGEEDIKQLAEQDAEKTGIPVEKLINYYKTSKYGEKLLDKKLMDFLKEKNNIQKVAPEKLSTNEVKDIK